MAFDQAKADAICERIAKGETLRSICREPGMPAWRTVYDWREENADFAARFARAREVGFDAIAAECFEIADDASNDYMTRVAQDGSESVSLNAEHVQRSKLRIETRLKLLAKWDPKRYGDKIEQTLQGPDGKPAFEKIVVEVVKAK